MSTDDLIELSDVTTSLVVDPMNGGRLTALSVSGVELMGCSVNPIVPDDMRNGCFVMAPFPGRIPQGRFEFGGRAWQLPLNLGDNAAHGFVYDVPWQVTELDARSVTLSVEVDDRWPFGGLVTQRIELLERGVSLRVTLANEARAMPGALGLHPWFRWLHGDSRAQVEVDLGPQTRVQGSIDGRVPPRPWDACLQQLPSPPRARWSATGRSPAGWLEVRSETSTWTVYEQDPDAFCLEPQTHPIGCLSNGAAAVVEPGSELTLSAQFIWNAGEGV